MQKRIKASVIMLIFIFGICITAKLTSDAVRTSVKLEMKNVAASIDTTSGPNEIINFRTERQQLRQMQKSQLNEIIYDSENDSEIIASAQEELLKILNAESCELTLEGILKMRGFDDAIVTVNDNCVNALVRAEMLSNQDIAVILDHIVKETGISAGNVKIIPIN